MVEIATYADLSHMVQLASEFHELSPYSGYVFSPQGTRHYLIRLLKCPSTVIFVTDDGMISGSVADVPFCCVKVARENFWYVRPNENGVRTSGIRLLKTYQKWMVGKGAQIDMLTTIESDDISPEKLEKLLLRLGYNAVEHTHLRVV